MPACFLLVGFPQALAARTDDIDIPFSDDLSVVGRWRSVAYVRAPEEFSPAKPPAAGLFFKGLELRPGGR